MATISFRHINKVYDNKVQAVFDFNLEVADKEFIVLVGPSGCGKSTTLRMLAGLEEITSGEIYIDDKLINAVEPKNRDIAMVFQNYALYPHMTVYKNIAFGLKLRKIPKEVIEQRVKETAEILGLTPYLDRKPGELSGGQRQRVALGRAIVRSPKVFLMDEPLSNLDAKLRVSMRSEIAKIHEKVGATTIYVTHDQTEAMTMASRIVIMKDGFIQQIGTPEEVYNYPNNVFVGSFIGSPSMNFFDCIIEDNNVHFMNEDGTDFISISIPQEEKDKILSYYKKELEEAEQDIVTLGDLISKEEDKKVLKIMEDEMTRITTRRNYYKTLDLDKLNVKFGIRPEDIHLANDKKNRVLSEEFVLNADVVELLGNEFIIYSYIGSQRVITKVDVSQPVKAHEEHKYAFDLKKIHFFDTFTTDRIK